MAGDLAQVGVVPGGFGAAKDTRCVGGAIPTDPEPVAVGRLGAEPRGEALVDQRVGALVERLVYEQRGAGVCEPAAHMPRLSVAEQPCPSDALMLRPHGNH